MKTDIPLKRVTRLCPADLLPLLGTPAATVIGVETLDLPASQTSLDTLLHIRGPDNQDYLHLIEWQGYNDTRFLWRTLGYVAWLGQNRAERPILVTIIYISPADDTGDTISQMPEMAGGWSVRLSCVRLWEQRAVNALASGLPGLIALAPLMEGATPDIVEQAAQTIITSVSPPVQAELLAALGMFAVPLIDLSGWSRRSD